MKASDYIEDLIRQSAISRIKYRTQTGDAAKTVGASTASPYKFPVVAVEAVTGETGLGDFSSTLRCSCATGCRRRNRFAIVQAWQPRHTKQP